MTEFNFQNTTVTAAFLDNRWLLVWHLVVHTGVFQFIIQYKYQRL